MAERKKGRGLTYLRRSTTRQEVSLETQIGWAVGEAAAMSVDLDASTANLARMRAGRLHSHRGIRLDDGVSGADMTRPGFLALMRDAIADPSISHLFIYQRDRLARPEDTFELVSKEKSLLQAGLTIVYRGGVEEPMTRGLTDVGREIGMYIGYYESGEFLNKLAERIISAQRHLAEDGHRVGGNAPYGFVRVLVDGSGQVLQELPRGRTARQPGCHVRIMPKDEQKIAIWLYILELKDKGWGYKRISVHLNGLGIPSPGAGSVRTDQGAAHFVSGKWNHNTVKELCLNRAILGEQDYGRRSEGTHRRLGPAGPRLLADADRIDEKRTRVVMNDASVRITASIRSEPRFDAGRWEEIHRKTELRGATQRGVPRAQDPGRYPLSCRLVDLTDGCGSILYGLTNSGRALYKCGRYMRTDGAECESNAVDAEAMLRFTLSTLRQLVDRHGNRDRLRALLEERARRDSIQVPAAPDVQGEALSARLAELKGQLGIVERRMAIEVDEARYEAIAREFDRLNGEVRSAEAALKHAMRATGHAASTPSEAVDAAMALLDDVGRIASDESARAEVNPMLESLGLRIGLTFGEGTKGKKRVVRRLLGGVMAFGGTPLPVRMHGASNAECGPAEPDGSAACHVPETIDVPENPAREARTMADRPPSNAGRVDVGMAGLGDRVPDPASQEEQTPTRPKQSRPGGISITKVSRGERI